jgi:hypothetical protein
MHTKPLRHEASPHISLKTTHIPMSSSGESLILGKAHNDGNRVANASEHEGEDTAKLCQREAVTSRRKSRPNKCRVIVRCFFLHDLLIPLRSLGASYNLSAAYTCLHMEKFEEDPSWERSRGRAQEGNTSTYFHHTSGALLDVVTSRNLAGSKLAGEKAVRVTNKYHQSSLLSTRPHEGSQAKQTRYNGNGRQN